MKKHIRALRDNYLPAFLILAVLLPMFGNSQTYGGEIRAKNNSNVIGVIARTNDNLKVYDSAVLAKLNGTIAVTQSGTWNINNISGTITLPTGAATSANQSTANSSLATIAGAVSGTEMQVDVLTIPALTAGNNNIGDVDVASIAAGDNNIGNVDIVTMPNVTIGTFPDNEPFNIAQINGVTPLMGAGNTGTGSLRVTVATDQVAIPVSGTFWQATQPVSGTVTANLAAGTNNIGDVDVLTVPTDPFGANADAASATGSISAKLRFIASTGIPITGTVTVGSHAVTNAGTFAVQVDGNALTALQLIDDPVFVDNAGFTDNSSKVSVAGYYYDEVAGTALTENDVAAARINVNRALVHTIEDGSTRGRYATVTASNALKVDGSAVTQPVSGTVSITANSAVNVAQINGVTPLMGNGTTGTGSQRVTLSSDGTAISTTGYMSVKLDQTTPGTTNGVSIVPSTSGGYDKFYLVSAATTNATNIKASAGQVYGWYVFNANASARKIMFHNTSGTPTAGASTYFPLVIPAGSGANVSYPAGIPFSSGIAITTVTGTGDSDATAVAAGDLIITIFYK